MRGEVINAAALIGAGVVLLASGIVIGAAATESEAAEPVTITQVEEKVVHDRVEIPVPKVTTVEVLKVVDKVPEVELTESDKELIARVVYAEAGWEDEIGKRLVVDVILNRVRDPHFPNTVHGVVYQEHQFLKASTYSEACMAAVEAEMYGELDDYVAWFCSDGFICYGQQAYQHGGHYFNWLPEEWIEEVEE